MVHFFCLSLLITHMIGLNFMNHEAKDYFPGDAGYLNLSINTLQLCNNKRLTAVYD